MKTTLVLFLLYFTMLGVACKRQPEKPPLSSEQMSTNQSSKANLSAENTLRQELGLKVIRGDWILYRVDGGQEVWKEHGMNFPAKIVFKDAKGRVLADEDYYYSGNEFSDHEGHGWERITVHYEFGSKQAYLAYTGTNKTTETVLSKYFMTVDGASSDVVGAFAAVRKAAVSWPDGPK